MDFLPLPIAAMANYRQFIIYVLQPSSTRPGKFDKIPRAYDTGRTVSAIDPAHWTDFATASIAAKRLGPGHGVGFVFTDQDPFWFLDIDNAWNDTTQSWSAIALELYGALNGCAVEVSSSHRGLHIFGSDTLPAEHGCRNQALGIEFYSENRFVALTGINAVGDIKHSAGTAIAAIVAKYFPGTIDTGHEFEWTTSPCTEWSGNEDDSVLIERACASISKSNAFNKKARFIDLWEANTDALTETYPDSTKSCGYDQSAADAALAQHLAFWTGKNCERMQRLMERSALAREKWSREDYLPRTIRHACRQSTTVLSDLPARVAPGADPLTSNQIETILGNTYATVEQQLKYFAGCVYVSDIHRVLTARGILLKPEQFKSMYGGATFQMDNTNQRTTKNAFEAFTESQAFRAPKVDSTCFKPQLPLGKIITLDDRTAVNIYHKPNTLLLPGDTEPFHAHLKKAFPNADDRLKFWYYICALVQNQGVKFQWCPFIQGVEGNGKTFFSLCVQYVVGRRYTHFPKSAEITSRFNGWQEYCIFASIEDIYVPQEAASVMECMKPLITSERQELEVKGQEKVTKDVCVNFIINSNHKDGFRKSDNDRRIAPFFMPQQSKQDLIDWEMTGSYFTRLFDWANKDGFAAIGYEMMNERIPDEMNPAKLSRRAPMTSSTIEAIKSSKGIVEQEVEELILMGVPGFRMGWVSSTMLDNLLSQKGLQRRVPRQKRKELLESLGYIPHPELIDGRAPSYVSPDNTRPTLYVKEGHYTIGKNLGNFGICAAYTSDQLKSIL